MTKVLGQHTLWITAFLLSMDFGTVVAEDTIFLKNGDALGGEIQSLNDEFVTLTIRGEVGSSTGRIPFTNIDYIEFAPLPGEEIAEGSADLLELWAQKQKYLSRPRSNAGEVGLAAADALLESDSKYDHERALEIFRMVEEKGWDPDQKPSAKQGRLRSMIKLGQIDEAMRQAKEMAETTEEPQVLIEARFVMASAEFDQLQALEEEHPRWFLDDEVRPKRNAHLNAALDQFLFPYLFYGSEEEDSARGLIAAANVYRFVDDALNAQRCAEDVLKLYPATSFRSRAEAMIQQLSKPDSP